MDEPLRYHSSGTHRAGPPPARYLTLACLAAFIALLPLTRIADFDLFFHLRLGELAWETLKPYTLDTLSYTAYGRPQNTSEWLSNAVLYGTYKHLGFAGLGLMKSVLLLAVSLFAYLCFRNIGRGMAGREDERDITVPAALAIVAMVYALRFRLDLRPYYFTYVFLSAFIWRLMASRQGRAAGLYVLPVLQALWGNTHGGWILGPMLMGLFLVTETARTRRLPRGIALPALLVLAASAFGPGGIGRIFIGGFSPLAGAGARQLGEWQPLTAEMLWGYGLRYTLGYQVLLAGSALYLLKEAALKRFDPFLICVFIAAVIYPLKALRLISIASIMLAPMFFALIRDLYGLLGNRGSLRLAAHVLTSALIVCLIVFSVINNEYYSFGFGPKEGIFPDAALDFLDRHGVQGNAFNTVTVGSYMLWKSPHRKTFIDGRLVPAPEVDASYDRAIQDMEGFKEMAGKYNVNYAIVDYDPKARWRYPLHLNASEDWALVFWDQDAAVFLKRSAENEELIGEEGYSVLRPYFNDFAYLDMRLNKGPELLRLIDEDIGRNPENQEGHLAKAYVAFYLGRKDVALMELRTAISMEPDIAFEHIALAQLLALQGEPGKAEKELLHALKLEPGNAQASGLLKKIRGRP